jgi:hypothetical protein
VKFLLGLIKYHVIHQGGPPLWSSGQSSRGPGLDSLRYEIFWEAVGLKCGSLSVLRITEELLERKVAAPVYNTEINEREDPLRRPRDTPLRAKVCITWPTATVAQSVYFTCGLKPTDFFF